MESLDDLLSSVCDLAGELVLHEELRDPLTDLLLDLDMVLEQHEEIDAVVMWSLVRHTNDCLQQTKRQHRAGDVWAAKKLAYEAKVQVEQLRSLIPDTSGDGDGR